MILLIYFAMFNSLYSSVYSLSDNFVLINTNSSTIIGRKLNTILGNKPFVAFWKIPYAEPPIGELRFKPPKENKWYNQAVYNYSNVYNETCASGFTEDCLYLSIYKPITDNKTVYPVIVWIHEESYLHGPDFLIDEEVIVVTVSFRVTILGFLNTGDDFAKGNMGAKDVLMALKWIRNHISNFNGDPNRVTVIGSGASASSVASFVLTVAADDLFSRLVIQSGSALSPADYRNYNFDIANKLFWNLNGPFKKLNRTRLYEILSKIPVNELTSASRDLFDSTEVRDNQRLINSFGPTVETSKRHAFMNSSPSDVYKRRMSNNNAQVMIGYTSLESLHKLAGFVNNTKLLKYLNYNFQYLLPFEGRKDEYGSMRYKKIRRKIMDFYFVNGTIGERSLRRYAKYLSDQVIYPALCQARLHAGVSNADVYLYRFSFKGSLNTIWSSTLGDLSLSGATAGDDICYQFRCKSAKVDNSVPSNERRFIRQIARLLANFAKYGNPTPNSNDSILGDLKWKPLLSNQKLRTMNLARNVKMINIPEEKRMKFWDRLKKEFFDEEAKDEL